VEQRDYHQIDFDKISYLKYISNFVSHIRFGLKSGNSEILHLQQRTFTIDKHDCFYNEESVVFVTQAVEQSL
jgi:hypothetical protein